MKTSEIIDLIDWIEKSGYKKDSYGEWYLPNTSVQSPRYSTKELIKLFKIKK